MLSSTVNVAAISSSGTRNDTPASLHCSVNLASFQGIQFSSFCTKYVIAIRARNTFHHPSPSLLPPPSSKLSSASVHRTLFFRDVGYTPSLYGPQSAAHVLGEILFSCWAPPWLSTNSPTGRYLINLWRRREFLVTQTRPPCGRSFRGFCGDNITLKPSRTNLVSDGDVFVSLIKTVCLIRVFGAENVCSQTPRRNNQRLLWQNR